MLSVRAAVLRVPCPWLLLTLLGSTCARSGEDGQPGGDAGAPAPCSDFPDPCPGPEGPVCSADRQVVFAGYQVSCGIAPDRTLHCWGNNNFNQVGLGSNSMCYPDPLPTPVFGSDIRDVDLAKEVTDANACAVSGQTVRCYGRGSALAWQEAGSAQGLRDPRQVQVGLNLTCAVETGGRLVCWGSNFFGQLGTADLSTPQTVVAVLPAVASLAVGRRHLCAVTTDARLMCWGDNRHGAVGNGDSGETLKQLTPHLVAELQQVVQVAAGEKFTCALTADGGIRCWGSNDAGQLGIGGPAGGMRSRPGEPIAFE